jgi:cation:H+ antiporter
MNLALIFLGFFLLVIGGEFIVRSSVALSLKFNISKFVIGMTVVSFATSLPELIVSINAAINGSPSIAVNNVVGSNIANIGLVLALIAILTDISVDDKFFKRDWSWMFFLSIIVCLFMIQDNLLDGFEGLLLIIFLSNFIYNVLKKSDSIESYNDIDDKLKLTSNFKILIWLIISSLTLYFGAEFLVEGAVKFAKQINISEAVISVTIVAIGTSIPELAASLVAIAKNEKGLSVGNLIGSNIFNIGSVLGITAIIKDIPIAQEIIQRDIVWMLVFATIIMVLSVLPERNKISKYKGIIMLVGYFVFIFQAFA